MISSCCSIAIERQISVSISFKLFVFYNNKTIIIIINIYNNIIIIAIITI